MILKVGQIVRLKSGGPVMTINRVDGDEITCVWFNEVNELMHGQFHELMLYWFSFLKERDEDAEA